MYTKTIYLAFATTRTEVPKDDTPRSKMASVLFPLVRPWKMPSFLAEWEHWFVLTDTTVDKRFPGKLKCIVFCFPSKSEFFCFSGIFISTRRIRGTNVQIVFGLQP